jgi:hypothetical protein
MAPLCRHLPDDEAFMEAFYPLLAHVCGFAVPDEAGNIPYPHRPVGT